MLDRPEPMDAESHVRLLALLGLIAAAVVALSAVVFILSWPTVEVRPRPVLVEFVEYNLATGTASSSALQRFQMGQVPAAVIPADSLTDVPSGPVRAAWFDMLGYRTHSIERSRLADLTDPVPLSTTSAVAPGDYQFVLTSLKDSAPASVLAWVHVEIER